MVKEVITQAPVLKYFDPAKPVTLQVDASSKGIGMVHFSRFGIPEQLKSDNGPLFTSEPFSNFARDWHFTHVTSSPHHQSSNGLSEIYVKLAKRILQKAKDANCDPYLPLLEHRNSPLPAIGYSPSQLLQGRRLRSILPATHEQLSPKPVNAKKARENMQKQQTRSKFYYDRSTRSLPSLQSGENITFQKTSGEKWEPGKVLEQHNERSYKIQASDGARYRRNRMFIRKFKSNHANSLQNNTNNNPPLRTPDTTLPSIKDKSKNAYSYVTRSGRSVRKSLRAFPSSDWVV
ncbi:uncharacterized protein LOC128549966 [Mercenaria mercenaria]|uniref:uncharacterized protein LOC128549966 n=1 Tax=Mercenaria mercenaria TaxID=6596 RepID=UPI00234EDA47|nr:uncharacterized protein LOC128549966 [Mercenaria mercenaria]